MTIIIYGDVINFVLNIFTFHYRFDFCGLGRCLGGCDHQAQEEELKKEDKNKVAKKLRLVISLQDQIGKYSAAFVFDRFYT